MGKSEKVDEYIAKQPKWQQANLLQFRKHIHEANPDMVEEIKWGVPVFLLSGKNVFAMSGFKAHTKFNFILNGALLENQNLFNNGLESKQSRGIDLREGEQIDASELTKTIAAALRKI